jgi:membrane-anchored protein YejM (alkaline phosphatase superfamily)
MAKTENHKFFKSMRGSYIPVSSIGWMMYIPFIGYLVYSAKIVFDQSQSNSYRLLTVSGQWIIATLVMTMIAKKFS